MIESNLNKFFHEQMFKYLDNLLYLDILLSFLIFVSFYLLRKHISKILLNKMAIFAEKIIKDHDVLLKSIEPPMNLLPIFVGFFISIFVLDYPDKYTNLFSNINKTLLTILIFSFIHQLIIPIAFMIKVTDKIISRDLLSWLANALKILIIIIASSSVLELWGIKIGPIIAGLGLFGVAVALGAQDLFKNLISGILVLVEGRFKVGDVIEVENVVDGVVEKISFRSTTIRKFDKSLCTIPNFQFAENAVINISKISNRRINWIIGLEYRSSVSQLKKVKDQIENYIRNDDDFVVSAGTPVIVRIDKFSASSIDILVRCYTGSKDYQDWVNIKDKLALEIKKIVEENKTGFAFPSQSLYLEKK